MHFQLKILIFLFSMLVTHGAVAEAESKSFEQIKNLITSKSFAEKTQAVSLLAAHPERRTTEILNALLEGELYYRKTDKLLLITKKQNREYIVSDAITGQDLGVVKKREIKKITTNNSIRKKIRAALAVKQLDSEDAVTRYQAVNQILGDPDAEMVTHLQQRLEIENDKKVRQAIELALAITELESADKKDRLAAIAGVSGSIEPAVRGKLATIVADDPDEAVRKAAKKALNNISVQIHLYHSWKHYFLD